MTNTKQNFIDLIQSKIIHENGCQLWKGTLVKKRVPYYNGQNVKKTLWSMKNPTLEKNQLIKMTCDHLHCVNVEHMCIGYQNVDNRTWESIYEHIISRTDNEGECLIWNGCTDESGYGMSSYKGKSIGTHRLSYMVQIQSENIPKTLHGDVANVMHLCGKSKCVNKEHLKLGTVFENAQHKIQHGTHQRGETSKRATITEETAQKILDSKRKKEEEGYMTQKQRAKKFNTTEGVVRNIDARQTWGHLKDYRNNSVSARNKINERNRNNLKLQKDMELTEEQYNTAIDVLESKSTKVNRDGWDCWEYTNSLMHGYGQISIYNIHKGAHLWCCEAKYKRKRIDGEVAMHLCNNKLCVNPDHLEFGTVKQNGMYSAISGTNKSCKLTPELVKEIRESSLSVSVLINNFGVSESTIRSVKNGQSWCLVE